MAEFMLSMMDEIIHNDLLLAIIVTVIGFAVATALAFWDTKLVKLKQRVDKKRGEK